MAEPANTEGNNSPAPTSQNTTEGTQDTSQTIPNQTQDQTQNRGPMKLSDDMEVIWDGAKEPVKFSNLRGLQSQFTKVSQARAALEKQSQTQAAELERARNALRVALGQSVQEPRQDPLAEIKGLPYVKGEHLAQALAQSQQPVGQIMQVLQVMAQKIAEQDQLVKTLGQAHHSKSFDEKIRGFLGKLGLEAEDYEQEAKIFYLAHEGDDLDDEFPDMFKKFLDGREQRSKARRQRQIDQAKSKPFVPGKGGLGSTTGEFDTAGMSSKDIAEKLWPMLQGNDS